MLCHELGHGFRDHDVSLEAIMGFAPGEGFYDLFGAGNSEEGFAEAFAVYCQTPTELHSRYPAAAQQLPQWVSPADVRACQTWVSQHQ